MKIDLFFDKSSGRSVKIVRITGGKFRWLKHCQGAPRQRDGFDSRTTRYIINNTFNIMAKHQQTVSAGARVYYFDVRVDSTGNDYVSVTEINIRTKKRNCIYIHTENIDKFRQAFDEAAANVSKR